MAFLFMVEGRFSRWRSDGVSGWNIHQDTKVFLRMATRHARRRMSRRPASSRMQRCAGSHQINGRFMCNIHFGAASTKSAPNGIPPRPAVPGRCPRSCSRLRSLWHPKPQVSFTGSTTSVVEWAASEQVHVAARTMSSILPKQSNGFRLSKRFGRCLWGRRAEMNASVALEIEMKPIASGRQDQRIAPKESTLRRMAKVCSGVLPQQDPTILAPASSTSGTARAMSSGDCL